MKLPQAVQSCHELLVWIIPHIHKFPRQYRFTLGERLENRLLGVLEELLDAAYSKNPLPALQRANRHLDICRHLWRLGFELKILHKDPYYHGSTLMFDIGRQIGGWKKDEKKVA